MTITTLRQIVICEPLRTPIGRFGGAFKTVAPADLAAAVIVALMERTGLDGAVVDDVIFGQAYPTAEAAPVARVAALNAGLPVTVGGVQVDRRCGSGLQAILDAAMQVQTGVSDLAIAGGVDVMSQAPIYTVDSRWGLAGTAGVLLRDALGRGRETAGGRHYPVPGGMLETAENLRRDYSLDRVEQDELAVESQRRALAAVADGRFVDEIVPVTVPGRKGPIVVSVDETPRESTLEALAGLKPIMGKADAAATVTAGNASGQNDAAAACIVTTPERAAELGLTPLVRLASWARAGVEPSRMGLGPVPATKLALERAGLTLADIDLIELNEAFAAQVLAVSREWNFTPEDWARTNVNGSGISLGHPVGATGARILATAARHLQRTEGRYLLETMCIGGGQGLAAIFERA
ncbi:acetyl-CoA C-acyltransferase [Cryobacterium levicorallinum]|uniref:Probable acetyl-CoA acetyltransferase n=1 Tax=Cryobacterium levicorallinum TaxID=995038 RepID=A0A1I3C5A1_9MICO|nr:acetyl-CoA C-acetyltransferase [Cryobacterium levicorallinum]TFB83258.1 acetyl-CoA C-acyltransferase [Cryobacterium levicorallinum]GEP27575.1 acetyl-CoA acetyltransferase [Cryobacterium levicorallinum]SFH69758.1 acetyl-CoA C-acetyltransferase [Cryobacterium levicorallinum]